jgi:hypothetical protein
VVGAAELVSEDEILVVVAVAGEVALGELDGAVFAQRLYGLGVERDRAPRAPGLRRSKADTDSPTSRPRRYASGLRRRVMLLSGTNRVGPVE